MTYHGWKISEASREELLARFPPQYTDVVCHHVTHGLRPGCPAPALITVVGHAARDGVEALVAEVNGETKRLDDSLYHITHSLERALGKKPRDSNDIVKDYIPVERLVLTTVPFWVDSKNEEYFVYTTKQILMAYRACEEINIKPSSLDEAGLPMWMTYIQK